MVLTDFSDSCEWVPPATDHDPTEPVPAAFQDTFDPKNPRLADLTTIGVGGKINDYRAAETETEIVETIKEADEKGIALLVVGGGSNLLCSDDDFDGIVIQDQRSGVRVTEDSACGGAIVKAPGAQHWDEFVCACIDNDQMGIESLSGIPGTVGAAPVQNIGAYGHEIAQTLSAVKVYDRALAGKRVIPAGDLQLGYRTSLIKRSLHDPVAGGGRTWGPTGRFVVLEVEFQLRHASLSLPIKYAQLAQKLDTALGKRVDLRELREAVLELRASKGMLLNPDDPDSRSCGSFFTNPIISEAEAEELPEDAPRYPVVDMQKTNSVTGEAPVVPGLVKTSAAWLIDHAGFTKGFHLESESGPRASLSTKHVLALTNRSQASARDILDLKQEIQNTVAEKFGVELVPEPVLVGF